MKRLPRRSYGRDPVKSLSAITGQVHMQRLPRKFYARDTHIVARELLGKLLVREYRGKEIIARITEVEAYIGESDLASHARFGKTQRNSVMYGEAGHAYVYFIYGMYDMLNIVTHKKDFPAAILIRSAIYAGNTPGVELDSSPGVKEAFDLRGPGKLTRALHITRAMSGEDLVTSKHLYIADDGFRVKRRDINTSPRIGIAYAGKHAKLPWRYSLKMSS